MDFLEFPYGSKTYSQMLELRQAVLRKPLGLDIYAADLSGESGYRHFGLLDSGQLLACLMVVPLEDQRVQFKQMAVQQDCQGRGLGRRLMSAVEQVLCAEGIRSVSLNARQSATGFYENLGYVSCGELFYEVSIPHLRMEKSLFGG